MPSLGFFFYRFHKSLVPFYLLSLRILRTYKKLPSSHALHFPLIFSWMVKRGAMKNGNAFPGFLNKLFWNNLPIRCWHFSDSFQCKNLQQKFEKLKLGWISNFSTFQVISSRLSHGIECGDAAEAKSGQGQRDRKVTWWKITERMILIFSLLFSGEKKVQDENFMQTSSARCARLKLQNCSFNIFNE